MKYLTFILGAGASVPYGLPTGDELVRCVATHMLRSKYHEEQKLGQRLELYDPLSIDTYLMKYYSESCDKDALNSYKAYIAFEIIRSLQNAWLGNLNALEPTQSEKPFNRFSTRNPQNWLRFIIPELLDLYKHNTKLECPIKFISFNYDLSIESYLAQIIQKYVGTKEFKDGFLSWIADSIVHLYGQVGYYPWQKSNDSDSTNAWVHILWRAWSDGEYISEARLLEIAYGLAKNIRIIGQPSRADETHITVAKEWMENSLTLLFSGYAFHPDNNKLLDLENTSRMATNIIVGLFGTNKRTENNVGRLFQVGLNAQTKTNQNRHHLFNANQPADPTLNIHNLTTYNLLKDEVSIPEHYSIKK